MIVHGKDLVIELFLSFVLLFFKVHSHLSFDLFYVLYSVFFSPSGYHFQ